MNILEYIIKAKDQTGDAVDSAKNKIAGLGKSAGSALLGALGKMATVAGLAIAFKTAVQKSLKEAFEVEHITAQFKTLLGSLDAAKQRVAELGSFKTGLAGGLFEDSDIAKASMNLEKLTNGAMGGASAWKMIGDVAAATGNTMESVSFAVGKAFGQLAEGMPVDRAMMQLQALGILGPDVIKALKELEAQGGSLSQKWDLVSAALGRFKGGMEDVKNTTEGSLKGLKGALDDWAEWWGSRISALVRGPIADLTKAVRAIADGTLFDKTPSVTRDPLLKSRSEADSEAANKARMDAVLAAAQEKQDHEMEKIRALRQAQADVKTNEEAAQNAQKNLARWEGPGGFDRFVGEQPLPPSTARDFRAQGRSKTYAAALDRVGGGFQMPAQVGNERERLLLQRMNERLHLGDPLKVLDAQGFADKNATKLANKMAEGKHLSAAEKAALDPRIAEQANETREKRLQARVDKGGKLTREDFEFLEERKNWKKTLEEEKAKLARDDAARVAAQAKIDAVNKAKQDALDKIAANTDKLPDLLTAK
jgi:hypothetical protein